MGKARTCCGLVMGALLLSGCVSTHSFVVPEPVRVGSPEPARAESFANAVEQTTIVECATNSLVEVRVKRDFFNSLLGVLTLGLYQQTRIEYACGGIPDEDDTVLGGEG